MDFFSYRMGRWETDHLLNDLNALKKAIEEVCSKKIIEKIKDCKKRIQDKSRKELGEEKK